MASKKYSCCLTGSQCKPFNEEVTIEFSSALTIGQAKFYTAWRFVQIGLGSVAQNGGATKKFIKN